MRMRRLGWAGVEIDHDGHSLIIDAIADTSVLFSDEQFPAPSRPGATTAALVTHLHSDHADPVAIAAALAEGAPVLRPEPADGPGDDLLWTARTEELFVERGLHAEVVELWGERQLGPFRVTAGPSVDGLGDPQHCWIVECGGQRVLHAGDTVFHGSWWSIARRVGAIDVAFLPINGPVLQLPHLQPPSPIGAVMDPEQAAAAALILRARLAVPIHYGTLNEPPLYVEAPRATERFLARARQLGVTASTKENGDWFTV